MRHELIGRFANLVRLGRMGIALSLLTISPAHAYIDPGTGSMLLQMFGAAIAGAIFYFRELRIRLLALFSRHPAASSDADHEQADDERVR